MELSVRMRRKAWRPLILGVRSFMGYNKERHTKRMEEKEKFVGLDEI